MAAHQPWRDTDTLVPHRYIIARVNEDAEFKAAMLQTGISPQKIYKLVAKHIQFAGMEKTFARAKEVCQFVASVMEDSPWYFMTDQDGVYTNDEAEVKRRARNCLIAMLDRPSMQIIHKYAGRSYWRQYPEGGKA